MKYKIKKDLIFEKKGKKITIFDPNKSIIFRLNETASYILDRIKRKLENDFIVNEITTKYKIDKICAKKELDNTLKKLKNRGIIF